MMNESDIVQKLESAQGNLSDTKRILKLALTKGMEIPEAALKASLDSMSVTVEGATSGVLYSGFSGMTHSSQLAVELADRHKGSIAIINNTEAFNLLDNDFFIRAYKQANPKGFNELFDKSPRTGPNSLWDVVSKRFADNLSGDVLTITPNADARRVFAQTELPALLENDKVTRINGVIKERYAAHYYKSIGQGFSPANALEKVNDELVKSTSARAMVSHSSELALSLARPQQFAVAAALPDPKIAAVFNDAANEAIFDAAPVAKLKVATFPTHDLGNLRVADDALAALSESTAITKTGTKFGARVIGALPVIGIVAGVGLNTAEAHELNQMLHTAIGQEEISSTALLEYNTILTSHIAQGGDPTVLLGEIGVQTAFNGWAKRYGVEGELREALQPSSLGLMMKDGGLHVAKAAGDIGIYGIEKGEEGALALADTATRMGDDLIDSLNGSMQERKDIMDRLPTLDVAEAQSGEVTGYAAPINNYPEALILAQAKSMIAYSDAKLADPTADHAYYSDLRVRMMDKFEVAYETMRDEGSLAAVKDYTDQYGDWNKDAALIAAAEKNNVTTQPYQNTIAANNESHYVAKGLAM